MGADVRHDWIYDIYRLVLDVVKDDVTFPTNNYGALFLNFSDGGSIEIVSHFNDSRRIMDEIEFTDQVMLGTDDFEFV